MSQQAIRDAARQAREASLALAALPLSVRNEALRTMADAVEERADEILIENRRDLEAASRLVEEGRLTRANSKRLDLTGGKLRSVIESLNSVATLPDPLGRILLATELDEGLNLYRLSCPIGVIAVIFESRPDALPQIASLCFKSGNAVLLKGGKEAANSNRILAKVLQESTAAIPEIPKGWLTLLETREDVDQILDLDDCIDLIIPRGGNELVRHIMDNTKIPVTGHRDGICHTYVHAAADPKKAVDLVVDGKCQYPAVCNATETLLIDRAAAPRLLPPVAMALLSRGVELRLDAEARDALKALREAAERQKTGDETPSESPAEPVGLMVDATDADWVTEHLDMVLGVRVVEGIEEAVDHVNRFGSHHTDAIVTEDHQAAAIFMARVDSASVLHNASTRFADGFRYGLGAEVGISTEKIHSRGPVGLEGLTIYKYILQGDGHVVADYSGDGARKFTHRPIRIEQTSDDA